MKKVLDLIDSYIEDRINYDDFFAEISNIYGSDNSDWKDLSDSERDFVEEVYEKSTYTAEGLPKDDQDRKHGVIDTGDFREWLKELKQKNIQLWK